MNKTLLVVLFFVLAFAVSAEVAEPKENNYFKCVTGCIKKKLGASKWAALVKKCKTNVKCYIKAAGLTGLRCAAGCVKKEQAVENVENRYFKCVTNCIKKKLGPSKWAALAKKCKINVKCYIKAAGLTGLRCAAGCIKKEQAEKQTVENNYFKCVTGCIKKKLGASKWAALAKKCKINVKCYIKAAGLTGLRCAAGCIKKEQAEKQTVENNYFKCVTGCIKKKLGASKWAALVKKCKTNVKCYIKAAGLTGLRCAAGCVKKENESNVAPQNKWKKVVCILKCLKGKVSRDRFKKVFTKCKYDAACWKKAALKQYWKCRKVCDKTVQSVVAKEDKLKCMQDCLKKKLGPSKWEEIYNKCKKDIKCYLKEAGFAGVACGFECLSKKVEEPKVDKLKCMQDCLKKKLGPSKWEEIYNKCKKDIKCYLKEAGFAGVACGFECLSKVEKVEEPKNPRCVMKCLVKKLGSDKVREIFKKCKRDFKCWAKETGEVGKKCVKECKKPEIVKVVEKNFLKCVGNCIKKKLGPSKWEEIYNKCKKNVKCYIKEAGFTGLKCGIECA
eukprot:gene8943-892_t